MLAVSYLSFLATLSYSADPKNIGWFIALVGGWAIIFGISLVYQKKHMPNLLVSGPIGKGNAAKIYDIVSIKENKDGEEPSGNQEYKRANDESSIQINHDDDHHHNVSENNNIST